MNWSTIVSITCALVALDGCADDPQKAQSGCTYDSQCADGRICEEGRCVAAPGTDGPDAAASSGGGGAPAGGGGSSSGGGSGTPDGSAGGSLVGDDSGRQGAVVRTAPPGDLVHVRGELDLQFTTETATEIELTIDGTLLVRLSPPFFYTWDTSTYAEGQYSVVAAIPGGAGASRELTVVVDRTPPAVVTRYPVAGADNVWLEDRFGFNLSEPADPASITGTSAFVTRSNGTGVGATLTTSPDATAASLRLDAAETGVLTLNLADSITDRAGNPLPAEQWTFTLPPWVSSEQLPMLDFDLAMASTGIPYVIWQLENPFRTGVSYYENGQWTQLGPDLATGSTVRTLSIELDSTDRVVASFAADGYTTVVRWDGSAWAELGRLGGGASALHAMALDDADRPTIAWNSTTGFRVQTLDATWSESPEHAPQFFAAYFVQVASTSSGPTYVGFRDTQNGSCLVYGWESLSWSQVGAAFAPTVEECNGIILAATADGTLYAATGYGFTTGFGDETRLWVLENDAWIPVGTPYNRASPVDLRIGAQRRPFIGQTHGFPTGGMSYSVRTWDGAAFALVEGGSGVPGRPMFDLYGNDLAGIGYRVVGGGSVVVRRPNAR